MNKLLEVMKLNRSKLKLGCILGTLAFCILLPTLFLSKPAFGPEALESIVEPISVVSIFTFGLIGFYLFIMGPKPNGPIGWFLYAVFNILYAYIITWLYLGGYYKEHRLDE
ncbi:MAG: hypothetical protein P1U57_03760 [Oleibacter sp.]|nr:hypothetical protein [Thalassolituus sp.]